MGRNGTWIGGKLTERPSQVFRRHVGVVPYPEDDIPTIVDRLGYDECLLMGSDYPHAEGFVQPMQKARQLLSGLPAGSVDKILGENARKFFGI
jgi:predicted TIM-barrel fold metal-dependent hydrolase